MKTKLLVFFLCFYAFAKAQNVNIPDTNWKNWLVNNASVNTNGDGEIQVSEAVAFTGTLQPIGQNISDLTGLEAFINLERIDLDFNPLTTVDVSANAALRFLFIADTFIMTDLILPNNTSALQTLVLDGNLLSSLDISMYPNVSFLSVSDNQLTSLDMRNGNFQNIGPNDFDATFNPNLTCIAVDDVAYANSQWPNIDSQTSYATSCQAPCVVNIPDTNLKAALVANTAINTNGDTEIQCDEASAFSGNIVLTNAGISDLTGIEAFTFLNVLNVFQNQVTTADLSQNPFLTIVVLSNNNLTSLNLGSNSGLSILAISSNPITSIDVSPFPILTQLEIANTSIASIDVSQNTALTSLNASSSPITSVDVSANANLTTLILQDTSISSIDVSQNSQITTLDVSETSLNSVDVSNNTDLVIFRGTNGALTSMDFSNNPDLQIVSLTNNNLSSLDVRNGGNTNITTSNFSATGNPNLSCIDVDDVAFANANWTDVDAQVTFSLNCGSSSNNTPTAICQNFTLQLDANGNATLNPSDINNGSNDTDGTITLSLDQTSFSCADIGANTVTLTVTDNDGATDSCTAVVTVEDTILPVINTPTSATFSNDAGSCGASVFFSLSGSDNCGTPVVTSDIAPNSFFPVGTTTVTLTADDGNGNTSTDTFTITINDTEIPNINCPSNQTVTVNEGDQFEVPNYVSTGDVTFSDNCNGVSIAQTPAPGTMIGPGTQTITFVTTDAVGNTAACSFDLFVDEVLSLEDATITSLKMYPNPATDQVVIESNATIVTVEVYNLLGQRVLQTAANTFSVSSFKTGLYMVVLEDDRGQKITKRLLKN